MALGSFRTFACHPLYIFCTVYAALWVNAVWCTNDLKWNLFHSTFIWMPQNLNNETLTLVQVMPFITLAKVDPDLCRHLAHPSHSGIILLIWRLSAGDDDVIRWKHFPRYRPFVRGIHRSPVNSPHKGQWRRDLMFSLICVWMNGWVNNLEAGDLRRYRAHYDVTVMVIDIWHLPLSDL